MIFFKAKFDFIVDHIKDKSVLDIGFVETISDFSNGAMQKTQHFKLKIIQKINRSESRKRLSRSLRVENHS
jgi:hypothetical protein